MIKVCILSQGDKIIREIGEELIRDNHDDIMFQFREDIYGDEYDYVIARFEDKSPLSHDNLIYLRDKRDDDGIFLYQAKNKIKTQIMKIINGCELKEKINVLSGSSPLNPFLATLFNIYLAKSLANEGKNVLFLSLNSSVPMEHFGLKQGKKGLLKALYYFNNQEPYNPGIISSSSDNELKFIEADINVNELYAIKNDISDFIKSLIDYVGRLGFEILILDKGVADFNVGEEKIYVINGDDPLAKEADENYIMQMKDELNSIEMSRKVFIDDKGGFRINEKEGSNINWKNILKIK